MLQFTIYSEHMSTCGTSLAANTVMKHSRLHKVKFVVDGFVKFREDAVLVVSQLLQGRVFLGRRLGGIVFIQRYVGGATVEVKQTYTSQLQLVKPPP